MVEDKGSLIGKKKSKSILIPVIGRVAAGIPIEATTENGDVIIAMVNGDDATCKRLRKYKDGIELISNNPSYKPMFFSDMDVQTKPVRIIGKVVELRGKF